MSREIKFRAWDVFNGDMFPRHESRDLLVRFFREVNTRRNGGNIVHVMQFIGRLDSEGVEIYESDIVNFHYFYGSVGANLGFVEAEHELTGVVSWGEFGWAVSAIKGEHWSGYTGFEDGEGGSNMLDLCGMNESSIHEGSFKVIGNIHANPELMK